MVVSSVKLRPNITFSSFSQMSGYSACQGIFGFLTLLQKQGF